MPTPHQTTPLRRYTRSLIAAATTSALLTSTVVGVAGAEQRRDRAPIRSCSLQETQFLYDPPEHWKTSGGVDGLIGGLAALGGQNWLIEGTQENQIAWQVYNHFTKRLGTSGAFAVGVMANIQRESQFVPNVVQGGGRFDMPNGTVPKPPTGEGGGLYQFTPWSKYTESGQFARGGWDPDTQTEFVWETEFKSGVVLMFASYPADRTNGKFMGFSKLVNNIGGKVTLDPNAFATTKDPARAAMAFQLQYERPEVAHEGDALAAIAANKIFNPDNFPGDPEKLAAATDDSGDGGGGDSGSTRGDILNNNLSNLDLAAELGLFKRPCFDRLSGTWVKDAEQAAAMADANQCVATASGGRSGKRGGRNPDAGEDRMEGDSKIVNGVTIKGYTRLQPKTKDLAELIANEFASAGINTILGWREDPYPYHPAGKAIDVMIDNYQSPEGKALGDEINQFIWDNRERFNIYDTIWWQDYYSDGIGSEHKMENRGDDNENHMTHIHVTVDWEQRDNASGSESSGSSGSSKRSPGRGCANARSGGSTGVVSANGFALPAEGTFTSAFGPRWGTFHNGVDIANDIGTPIYAAMDGEVIFAAAGDPTGYGMWVTIRHDDGVETLYGHIDSYSVSVGDKVKAGDEIAKMGNRGGSTGPHLHFEVNKDGQHLDPAEVMRDNGIDFPEEGAPVTKDLVKAK